MSTFLEPDPKLGQNDQRIIEFSSIAAKESLCISISKCIPYKTLMNGVQNLEKDIITARHSFSAYNNIGGTQKSIPFHHFSEDCQETLQQN